MSPDFFKVVRNQRACRSFAPDDVDEPTIVEVLEAATFAPSAENRQPWVFVVVREPRRKSEIGEITRKAWEGGGRAHSEGRLSARLLEDVDCGAMGGISAAPVVVVVGGDSSLVDERVLQASVFPAVQNLLLAAQALGLGSALTTLPLVFGDRLSEIVGLPAHVRPIAVVPIGWPRRNLGPPRREPIARKAHRESFGARW